MYEFLSWFPDGNLLYSEGTVCSLSLVFLKMLVVPNLWCWVDSWHSKYFGIFPMKCQHAVQLWLLNSLALTCTFCSITRANATALISKPKSQPLAVKKKKAVSVRALVDIGNGSGAAPGLWDYDRETTFPFQASKIILTVSKWDD